MRRIVEVERLGRRDYAESLVYMRGLLEKRISDEVPDTLLLVEHHPVYTRGRRREEGEILDASIEIVEVERGGQITWHGPGQLVAYPIIKMSGRGRDLHRFLRLLEEVLIETLAGWGLRGERDPAGTGVFVEGGKIASIGIAVKNWVSFHGLCLNVCNDLEVYRAIKPCGLEPSIMTHLARELGEGTAPSLEEVGNRLVSCFEAGLAAYPR